jgi:outer membrane protein TolC
MIELRISMSAGAWRRCLVFVPVLLGLAPAPALAQQTVSSSWRANVGDEGLEEADGQIQLDLDEAISLALERNLGLRVQRYTRAQQHFEILRNMGIYDLNLGAETSASMADDPSASNLSGVDVGVDESQSLGLSLDRLLPTGGVSSVLWSNSRSETNNIFASPNPGYRITLTLVHNQPLLRNLGKLATERNLKVARTNSAIAFTDFEGAVIDTVQIVEEAYWTLVEARQQLTVAEESRSLAQELHEMNRIQVDVGTLAPLELIQSEVGIATRQEEIIRTQAAVDDAADALRRLLNVESPRLWSMEVVPVTDPEIERITIDLESAMTTALDERPDLAAQRLQLDNLELDTQVARNLARPRLDAQLRYGWNARDGDVRDREDPFDPDSPVTIIPGGYDEALQQIIDRQFTGWQVALDFGYPIQNREARAQRTIADLALEQGESLLQDLELQVRTDVRTAARAVDTAAQQIDSARVSMRLAEQNLDAERKRYENGLSTSFQVLEIQEDLTQARSREVAAITGYRRARVNYYRSIGRLLEENDIELVDEPERGEE